MKKILLLGGSAQQIIAIETAKKMGYYTIHKIKIINGYNTRENFNRLVNVITEICDFDFKIVGSVLIDSNEYGSKWYNCEKEMLQVSLILPKYKIKIKGKGEEGEIWERIYKNGLIEEDYVKTFSDSDEVSDFNEETESDDDSEEEDEESLEENKIRYKNEE